MRKSVLALLGVFVVASLLLGACAPQTVEVTKVVEVTKAVEVTRQVQVTTAAPVQPDRVQIYWYIGLGAGSQPDQIPLEQAWVKKYNDSQKEIQLIAIIVDNKYARDNLTAQLAAGNAPDIVGPVGTAGRAAFPGAFLDLQPLVTEAKYDMSDIDPAFLAFYKDEGKLAGLPFAIFPSFVYVNKDLFKEAKLELPPQKFGDKYKLDGKDVEWDLAAFTEVAKRLTLDKAGNDATKANFDKKNIVQYGFYPQWNDDPRAFGTFFGADYPVKDGKAYVPDQWKAAWNWYYDGIWKFGFMPNQAAIDSDALGKGNVFNSGKVAMNLSHLWYTCCIDAPAKGAVKNWDIVVAPSVNGKVTAKMHGDTFAIMQASKNQKAAFKVYTYMLGEGSADLYKIYGGLPARKSQQKAFFDNLDKTFAPNKVNWQVALDSIPKLDAPNHELGLPNNAKANDALAKLGSDMRSNDKLDMTKRIADFTAELDKIYAEVAKK